MDLEISGIKVYNMIFEYGNEVNYLKKGRSQFLLHYVLSGKRQYRIKSDKFTVGENNVIFITENTNYTTKVVSEDFKPCAGIGICFDITVKTEKPELSQQGIYFKPAKKETKDLFAEIDKLANTYPINYFELKSCVYKLLSCLGRISQNDASHAVSPAVSYLNEHYKENQSVSVYAGLCNLSESYFRKKFREEMGVSPIEYRNLLRFSEVERLYKNGFSLQKIAEKVGFCDAGYLSKLYKKHYGVSIKEKLFKSGI